MDQLKRESEEKALRVYVTDALKAIVENTGKSVKEGVVMRKRFADIINNVPDDEETEEQANKRAKKIIDNIKIKLGKCRKEDAGHATNVVTCESDG